MPRGLPITLTIAILAIAGMACVSGPDAGPAVTPAIEEAPRPVESDGHVEGTPSPGPRRVRPGEPAVVPPEPDGAVAREGVADAGIAEEAAGSDETVVLLNRAGLEQDLAGVESIGEVIGLRPHLTLRGIDGFTVTDLPASSPLAGIGLQRGDVIHAVNGRKLTSIQAAFEAGNALQNAEVLEGEITRDGQRRRLVVRFE